MTAPNRDDIQFQITAKIKEYEKKIKKLEVLEIPVTFETLFETVGKRMDCTSRRLFQTDNRQIGKGRKVRFRQQTQGNVGPYVAITLGQYAFRRIGFNLSA